MALDAIRLNFERVDQIDEGEAETIQLVEQIQHEFDAFIIDTHRVPKIANECGAGNIDVAEYLSSFENERRYPAPVDEDLQLLPVDIEVSHRFGFFKHLDPHMLAWIDPLARRPASDEFFQLRIRLFRKDDLECRIDIAPGTVPSGHAFSLQPQRPAAG